MSNYSFFHLTTPPLRPSDAVPGISCEEETWFALIDAMHEALNTMHDHYPDLTWGDVIHAAKYLAAELTQDWAEDTADA